VIGPARVFHEGGARARVAQEVATGGRAEVQVGDDDGAHAAILASAGTLPVPVSSLFCRHNRFTADCPICSKGTVLDAGRASERRPRRKPAGGTGRRGRTDDAPARQFSGPHVTAGPYERDGGSYEVRLERVPGGVRLAEWSGGRLERRAPELPAADLATLVGSAVDGDLLSSRDAEALREAMRAEPATGADAAAASPGRSGDMREELRVERLDAGRVRVGRWLLYPSRGWELQHAAPMLPAARYAEALRGFLALAG
jgi:hypothetical protein